MAHHLAGHITNAVILTGAAILALAVNRLSADPAEPARIPDAGAYGDIAGFLTPVGADSMRAMGGGALRGDPFAAEDLPISVAPSTENPTVNAPSGRRLTAILIADDRPVAVVDDAVVGVGDVLRDGSRVSAISADRVWVVEKNGQWRMLTLSAGRR